MKVTRWAALKLAVVVALTVSVVLYPVDSLDAAHTLGMLLASCAVIMGLFQLALWFSYDVISLKRGGWVVPPFGASPFAPQTGPSLHLAVLATALLTIGIAKMVAAIFQGSPALFLGGWFVAIGLFLRLWQLGLHRLFRGRFTVWNDESSTPSGHGLGSH